MTAGPEQIACALIAHAAAGDTDGRRGLSEALGYLDEVEELRLIAGTLAIWLSSAQATESRHREPWLDEAGAIAVVAADARRFAAGYADRQDAP